MATQIETIPANPMTTIDEFIIKHDLTQKDFAKIARVSESMVCAYRKGDSPKVVVWRRMVVAMRAFEVRANANGKNEKGAAK